MAQYKTIALGLIHDRPELYERLRSGKMLLPAMDAYAAELRDLHRRWQEQIARSNPGRSPARTAAEALELAIEGLKERLPSGSGAGEAEPPSSLDDAMASVRRATPSA